jgi:uncharacterized protein
VKLHLSRPTTQNLFTGHGAGYVMVNGTRYEHSLIVMPERAIEAWQPAGFDQLDAAHFEHLLGLSPEIVLLGTGAILRFPPPVMTQCLAAARIGFEVMNTSAACRTYNILIAEGRNAAAALVLA